MKKIMIWVSCLLHSSGALAELIPLSEEQMREQHGQALIEINQYQENGLNFVRVDTGFEVKVQLNADEVVFGEYPRAGETQSADIDFDNFALGHIENGEIVPFELNQPFLEYAYDPSSGSNDLVGLRVGFGDSKGKMSFDINSLTGNIDVLLQGDYDADTFLGTFTVEATSRANLVNSNGDIDPIRATQVGVPNGSSFDAVAFGFIPVSLNVNNCTVSGFGVNDNVCFPLSNYKTLDIGEKVSATEFEPAPGLFLSFQSRDMVWGRGTTDDPATQTFQGAFFNIPNGSLTLTPEQALNGIPRAQTEFINRGVGRFTSP